MAHLNSQMECICKRNTSDQLLWETLNVMIWGKNISHSTNKKKEKDKRVITLENEKKIFLII